MLMAASTSAIVYFLIIEAEQLLAPFLNLNDLVLLLIRGVV